MELDLHTEWLLSVDLVLATWSEVVDALVVPIIDGVLDTEATVLAVVGVGTSCRSAVTRMSGGLDGVLVGLHNVELRAVLSIDSLSITVVEAISLEVVSIDVLGWGSDEVKGG